MRLERVGLMVVALALAAASACGADNSDVPMGGKPSTAGDDAVADFAGRTFVSTAVTEQGEPRKLVDGTKVTLVFAKDGWLGLEAGCNHISADDLSLDGGALRAGAMGTTDMACEPELMDQDQWLIEFVDSEPSWRLDGDQLVLTSAGTEIQLTDREVAEPDLPLEGTKWMLDAIYEGDSASFSSAMEGGYLIFADGEVTGSTGCNNLTGLARVDRTAIEFEQVTAATRGCQVDFVDVEQAMLAVLDGPVEFSIDSDKLTLAPGAEQGLGFHGERG